MFFESTVTTNTHPSASHKEQLKSDSLALQYRLHNALYKYLMGRSKIFEGCFAQPPAALDPGSPSRHVVTFRGASRYLPSLWSMKEVTYLAFRAAFLASECLKTR